MMDLIGSFKPTFRIFQAVGIAPYKFGKGTHLRNKLYVSPEGLLYSKLMIFVNVVTAAFFVASILCRSAALYQVPSVTVKWLFFSLFCANAVAVYVTVVWRSRLICHQNNLINGECSVKDFGKLSNFNRNLVLLYCVLHVFGNAGSFLARLSIFTQLHFVEMFQWFFLCFWSLVEDFQVCQILCFASLAGFKLKQINKRLSVQVKLLFLKDLQLLRAEDLLVKDYVQTLNDVFQYNLLFNMSQLFMSAVSISFGMILEDAVKFRIFGFLFYILCRLIPIFSVFEYTRMKAEKTANYVHELFLDNDDPEIREEIEIFSLQLQHRKVEFNACGFFKLDFTLLYSMIGAVTTYIIILMQFQREDPTSAEWRPKKTTNCSSLFHHYSVEDVYRCLNNSTSGRT